MAARERTQKQRDQWATRNLLGQITSLPRWNQVKAAEIMKSPLISRSTKDGIEWAVAYLGRQLLAAEAEVRSSWQTIVKEKTK